MIYPLNSAESDWGDGPEAGSTFWGGAHGGTVPTPYIAGGGLEHPHVSPAGAFPREPLRPLWWLADWNKRLAVGLQPLWYLSTPTVRHVQNASLKTSQPFQKCLCTRYHKWRSHLSRLAWSSSDHLVLVLVDYATDQDTSFISWTSSSPGELLFGRNPRGMWTHLKLEEDPKLNKNEILYILDLRAKLHTLGRLSQENLLQVQKRQ